MNAFVLGMIGTVMLSGWAVNEYQLPRLLKLLPEAFSAIALLIVVAYGVRDRFRNVRPAYWFAFAGMSLCLACGAIANAVDAGPVVSGLRNFVRAVPFFLLPAVYAFSERQVRTQLQLIVLLCLPQLPLALSQRNRALSLGNTSGDDVVGTLLLSGTLSIFMICVACGLAAFYLRRRIRLSVFVPLFVLVLLPTAINETKATVLMLPIALIVTFIVGSEPRARLRSLLLGMVFVALFGAIFVPLYDHYIVQRQHGATLAEFFTSPEKVDDYMGRGADIGATKVGRTDSIVVPLRASVHDPVRFALGLGMGNVTGSPLGYAFSGEYADKLEPFVKSSASLLILEAGVLGLLIALAINWLAYRDARVVAARDRGFMGAVAVGWCGALVAILLGTFYANLIAHEAISYLFWYVTGLVAAHRMRRAA